MRFSLLACDYDETLARHGRVDEATMAALSRLAASGRKLMLVTGRRLDDLLEVFPDVRLFSRIVAENGAVSYDPASHAKRCLAEPPPPEFLRALEKRGVAPLSVGEVIVATHEPEQATVLDVIRELGMGHQVIFNKGAVMVLPPGVDKGTGLVSALDEIGLSPHNVVGVGDAENDHAFLQRCEVAAAVSNALPLVKQRADLVTEGASSEGVVELIDALLSNDLARLEGSLLRHHLLLGKAEDGREFRVPPYGTNILIAGPSGSGKSQTTMALLERIIASGYQACIVDPEGDYEELDGAVSVGEPDKPPSLDEVQQLLKKPSEQVVVNLLGVPLADRPGLFALLLPRLQSLRTHTGRPHWILVDEAHHLLPSSWVPAPLTVPQNLGSLVAITVHPDQVSSAILGTIQLVLAVGADPESTLASFCSAVGLAPPRGNGTRPDAADPKEGDVLAWFPASSAPPQKIEIIPAGWVHRRHSRKYAQGELAPDRSFYFRGPHGKLKLRAQNLVVFLQIAEGVDEPTWLFHLRRGDYSRWFREHIKDETLARAVERIERGEKATAAATRTLVRQAIEERYTLPA
jgi:hydroxymethylpyrimidine pyrophosphatase-like HAD family hydrolase